MKKMPARAGREDAEPLGAERAHDLGEALAAYYLLLDNMLTARRHFAGERRETGGVEVWGNIVERADARQRRREAQQDE